MLCVVRLRSPRLADHSSRGILPSVVCLIEYDHESSIKRRPWPTSNVSPGGEGNNLIMRCHNFSVRNKMEFTDYAYVA